MPLRLVPGRRWILPTAVAGLAGGLTWAAFASSTLMGPSSAPARARTASERVVERQVQAAQEQLLTSLRFWEEPTTWQQARRISGRSTSIRTTRSTLYAKRIEELVEETHDAFARLMDVDPRPASGRRVEVWIAPDIATYNGIGNQAGADELSSRYGGYYCAQTNPPAVLSYDSGTWTHLWVMHGAGQEILTRLGWNQGPTWLWHALPSLLEVQPGAHYTFAADEMRRIQESQWTPLAELFRDPQQWQTHQLRQAGMLLEYLVFHCEETCLQQDGRWPAAEYLRAALGGAPVEESTVTDLLGEGLADLDDRLHTFEFPATR